MYLLSLSLLYVVVVVVVVVVFVVVVVVIVVVVVVVVDDDVVVVDDDVVVVVVVVVVLGYCKTMTITIRMIAVMKQTVPINTTIMIMTTVNNMLWHLGQQHHENCLLL